MPPETPEQLENKQSSIDRLIYSGIHRKSTAPGGTNGGKIPTPDGMPYSTSFRVFETQDIALCALPKRELIRLLTLVGDPPLRSKDRRRELMASRLARYIENMTICVEWDSRMSEGFPIENRPSGNSPLEPQNGEHEDGTDTGTDTASPPYSGFFIVNDFDRPDEERIAGKGVDGKFYYIHPVLRMVTAYWGMTPENPTPLELFGISIAVIGGEFRGCYNNESTATYPDGSPRRWQGQSLFSFPFKNVHNPRTLIQSAVGARA